MKKRERLAALAFFLFAGGAALKAVDIGFGTFKSPGPGFFPFWLAVLMAAVSAAYFIANRGEGAAPLALWPQGAIRRPAIAAVVMFGFVLAMDFLGFCTATFMLFAAWLRGVEGEKWAKTGLVAVIGTGCIYAVFGLLLGLSLPRGLLV